jgi:hypothetical protein
MRIPASYSGFSFVKLLTWSSAALDECDYNMHLSNSSYAKVDFPDTSDYLF